MARIRTIKPEFFRHAALYDAEKSSGLPLRLAFAGLWTAADREGRFRWQPRVLKLDCLPYDECDFDHVLEALARSGFIMKYEINGESFGCIPGWKNHQIINNRESESKILGPDQAENARVPHACPTRHDLAQGEGKGREGEGKEIDAAPAAPEVVSPSPEVDFYRRIKQICGPSGGGLGKKLLDAKGGSVPLARAAVEQASTKQDPREYLGAIIRGRGGGVEDLRARGEAW